MFGHKDAVNYIGKDLVALTFQLLNYEFHNHEPII